MALGARAGDVLSLVFRQGLSLAPDGDRFRAYGSGVAYGGDEEPAFWRQPQRCAYISISQRAFAGGRRSRHLHPRAPGDKGRSDRGLEVRVMVLPQFGFPVDGFLHQH